MNETTDKKGFPAETDIERLVRLQDSDAGFFSLALHACMERWLRDHFAAAGDSRVEFGDLMHTWFAELEDFGSLNRQAREILFSLIYSRKATNEVRHGFRQLYREEVSSLVASFLRFASLAGFSGRGRIRELDSSLEGWLERKSGQSSPEFRNALFRIETLSREIANLSARVAEADVLETEKAHLSAMLAEAERRAELAEKRANATGTASDELRKERFAAREELRKVRGELSAVLAENERKLAELSDAREYIETLRRVAVCTRTRREYEAAVLRLSPAQSDILDRISLRKDFLVKGAAGTGKSLVLMKALEKAVRASREELGLGGEATVRLLTYTKSLVAWNAWISGLLNLDLGTDTVSTVDKFLLERFRLRWPDKGIVYKLTDAMLEAFPETAGGLDRASLALEAENFLWANMIGEEEYVTGLVPRSLMKKPLRAEARAEVWAAVTAARAAISDMKVIPRNLAACMLTEAGTPRAGSQVDWTFVDEAQDLPASVLAAIRLHTRNACVLAGDSDQSIYVPGFSWKRAGIDVSGRSRALTLNFRNTEPIHAFAEAFRARRLKGQTGKPGTETENGADLTARATDPSGSHDESARESARDDQSARVLGSLDSSAPEAYRPGPPVSLIRPGAGSGAAAGETALDSVASQVAMLTGSIGYDPENICVIALKNDFLETVQEALSERLGIRARKIAETSFRFEESGVLRLSTMHSSKGLDFPAVILVLDHTPRAESWDEATAERMFRNLVYVAATRAMELLTVIIPADASDPVILDAAALLGG